MHAGICFALLAYMANFTHTADKATEKHTRAHGTYNFCGAVGPIAYRNGKPWSVNTFEGKVMDWRYQLDHNPGWEGCPECTRLVSKATV